MTEVAVERLGVRVIEQTERFTLLGADARRGKLTLFDAEGPRERGPLARIGLRVSSLDGRDGTVDLGEGLEIVLVEAETDSELDLDHIALVSADPAAAAEEWQALGFAPAGARRLEVGGAYLELLAGDPGDPERPLLNHIGVLVDSVEEHRADAEDLGIEIDDLVDAPNTIALFVWGPDRVKLEYIEHKPSFSLT
jgi:catechol 2,3-dioxygenase-like lactoylglutathione lyase family enzyme